MLMRIALAISLLLMLASAVLWVRGYFARDGVWYSTNDMRYSLHSYRGRIFIWTLSIAPNPSAMTWSTPAKMGLGWVIDSVPDSWYAPYIGKGKSIHLDTYFTEAPRVSDGPVTDKQLLGFRYVSTNHWLPLAQLQMGYPTAISKAFFIPHWAMLAIFAIMPGIALLQFARSRNRHKIGHCRKCGYDLRATPEKCPECGATSAALPPGLTTAL
jgi:hypothetical protein